MLMFALVVCTLLTRSCWFAEPQRCRGPVISTSTTNVARCTSKRKTIARSAPTAVAHASVATWLLFSLLPQALEDYSKLTRLNPSDAVRSTIACSPHVHRMFTACSPHVHRPCACAPCCGVRSRLSAALVSAMASWGSCPMLWRRTLVLCACHPMYDAPTAPTSAAWLCADLMCGTARRVVGKPGPELP